MASFQWDFQPTTKLCFHVNAFNSMYRNSFCKDNLAEFPEDLDPKFYESQQEIIRSLKIENEQNQSHISNRFSDQGVKFSTEWQYSNMLWIAGAERSWYKADYGWDRLYRELEDDYLRLFFDYAPEGEYFYHNNFDHTAGFMECKWDASQHLSFRPGLRLTRWNYLSKIYADPRLNIRYEQKNWHTSFSIGSFSQGISTTLEEGLVGFLELYFPLEGQNNIETANHYILDFVRDFSPITRLSMAVYYKDFSSLLKSVDEAPRFRTSSGDAKGIEVGLKTKLIGCDIDGSYAWSRSRRHYAGQYYDTNFDFRHRIQLSVHRSLPGGLDISA